MPGSHWNPEEHRASSIKNCLLITGSRLLLLDLLDAAGGSGKLVGRLAKGYALPDRTLAAVKVSAIVVRKPQRQEDQIRARPKVDEWETMLCDLTFE